MLADGRSVYGGTTYFGFFTHQALSQQVGLREAVYRPGEEELEALVDIPLEMNAPTTPGSVAPGTVFQPTGLAMPGKALCMIDGIEIHHPAGGPHGLGFIRGYKIVDPKEWFFEAHFYQDPVCPGSLGIESFLQLRARSAWRCLRIQKQSGKLSPIRIWRSERLRRSEWG